MLEIHVFDLGRAFIIKTVGLNGPMASKLLKSKRPRQVCEMVRAAARSEGKAPEGTPNQLYAYFVERCQKLLAIVLCFSPIGDAWRARIRQPPGAVRG